MILEDRQALRKCVKQAVRHARIHSAVILSDPYGPQAPLPGAAPAGLMTEADLAMAAALGALGLEGLDEAAAEEFRASYTKEAWVREMLDTGGLGRVLVRLPLAQAGARFEDDRLEPMLQAEARLFAPGRFGTDYRAAADTVRDAMRSCGARHLFAGNARAEALERCLLPLCEEEGYVLHVSLSDGEDAGALARLSEAFAVRLAVSSPPGAEREAIGLAAGRGNLLLRVREPENLPAAFRLLGLRFIPAELCAPSPEMLLGRVLLARERIWRAMADAYLPMARAGCELTAEQVERDAAFLLGGNLSDMETNQTERERKDGHESDI